MSIQVRNVTKYFDSFRALDEVSLDIPDGELTALLGPSGCGKTTLLRIIAGLDVPDRGAIYFHGEDATARHAREREVGFVFQHYALFRHMSVFENIAFGLRVRPRGVRPTEEVIRTKVHELLKLVQLDWLAERYPSELSGGQRQRIALARALAVEPKVLLLDEPFGALDAKVRKDLRRWLRRLHDELHVTTVFVTHDQEEALEVADRIVILNEGRVQQYGAPDEVYAGPASPFVYHFLGDVNLFHGRVRDGRAWIGDVAVDLEHLDGVDDVPAQVYARPHEIDVERHPNGGGIEAVVRDVRPLGDVVRIELERRDGTGSVEVKLSRERYGESRLAKGERVYLRPRNPQIFLEARGPIAVAQ
jgi:sulfate transport system ATP-binding protein